MRRECVFADLDFSSFLILKWDLEDFLFHSWRALTAARRRSSAQRIRPKSSRSTVSVNGEEPLLDRNFFFDSDAPRRKLYELSHRYATFSICYCWGTKARHRADTCTPREANFCDRRAALFQRHTLWWQIFTK